MERKRYTREFKLEAVRLVLMPPRARRCANTDYRHQLLMVEDIGRSVDFYVTKLARSADRQHLSFTAT